VRGIVEEEYRIAAHGSSSHGRLARVAFCLRRKHGLWRPCYDETMGRSLTEFLRIETPIIQAPMAGTSTPAMAAAVSNAGGLGSISVAAVDAATGRRMIRNVKAATDRPFNVNVFCHAPAVRDEAVERAWIAALQPVFAKYGATTPASLAEIYGTFLIDDAKLEVLIEERPAVVSFHFGVPCADRIRRLKDAGIILLATATSLDEARQAVAAGVDAIVAQGYEAGGHRGTFNPDEAGDDRLGTFALVQVLAKHIDRPIIAAGGIMHGTGIAAAMKLGAAGAQLGTAFIACPESSADAGHRAALFSNAAHHTVMTDAISGRLARCLPNRFTELADSLTVRVPAYPVTYDVGKALNAAAKAMGEYGFGAQWAGQGAPLARSMPAAELVATLRLELEAALP
jgi:nitronate monooxygenase